MQKGLACKLRVTPLYGLAQVVVLMAPMVAGCSGERTKDTPTVRPADVRSMMASRLPRQLPDSIGWTTDLYAAFSVLGVEPTRKNICAVIAVIGQESSFHVDPVIPGLPAMAWREIDERAAHADIPRVLLHGFLQLKSPTGRTYAERIDAARTERELSDVYQDLIGSVPLGRTLFADHDPIRTRGPMQVHIAFAERYAEVRPYPYPVKTTIANEVFTRRGGLYFGVAHLLAYAAPYDDYRYRFADFNAGQYASRNAAFQQALGNASGIAIVRDGSLLENGASAGAAGETELAARALGPRIELDQASIRRALERGKTAEFSATPLYQRVFELADRAEGHAVARAAIPQIELHGPKISRKLTTEWYANRVNARFERCLKD